MEVINSGGENSGGSTGRSATGVFVLGMSGSSPSLKIDKSIVRVKESVSRLIMGGGESLKATSGGNRRQSGLCKIDGSSWRRAKDSWEMVGRSAGS